MFYEILPDDMIKKECVYVNSTLDPSFFGNVKYTSYFATSGS